MTTAEAARAITRSPESTRGDRAEKATRALFEAAWQDLRPRLEEAVVKAAARGKFQAHVRVDPAPAGLAAFIKGEPYLLQQKLEGLGYVVTDIQHHAMLNGKPPSLSVSFSWDDTADPGE